MDTNCMQAQVCEERFKQINAKLDEMHADQKRLSEKVLNGITDRITALDKDVLLLKESRQSSDRVRFRMEAALISCLVPAIGGLVWWVITQRAKNGM